MVANAFWAPVETFEKTTEYNPKGRDSSTGRELWQTLLGCGDGTHVKDRVRDHGGRGRTANRYREGSGFGWWVRGGGGAVCAGVCVSVCICF